MAIAVTRFTSLDKEFDTALVSISESDPRQIMNAGFNTITDIAGNIKDAISRIAGKLNINNLVNGLKKAKSKLEAAIGLTKALSVIKKIGDTIRSVRGMIKSTFDSSKFSSKDLERYISDIFSGNSQAFNLFKGMNPSYRDSVLSNVTLGKPFDKIVLTPDAPPGNTQTFTKGNQTYDYPAIAGLVSQVSGSGYGVKTIDNNMILKKVVTTATLGYDANMSGVMKKLLDTPDLNRQVRDRCIGIIMTEQANKGNVAAILDMADPVAGVLSDSNSPLSASPSIITDLMTNFQIPKGIKDEKLQTLATSFLTSMETLDPKWKESEDGMQSLKNVTSISEDMSKTMQSILQVNVIDENDLDSVFDQPNDVLVSAMVGFDVNTLDELNHMARTGGCAKTYCNC